MIFVELEAAKGVLSLDARGGGPGAVYVRD